MGTAHHRGAVAAGDDQLPIIGVVDPHRARQLTEQLLRGIRTNRARVAVIDITGVAAIDAAFAPVMMVPILKQGHLLIATIMTALSDEDMRQFREALLDRVVSSRASAVIIDVMAMDVLDSFATRTLRQIAYMTKRRQDRSGRRAAGGRAHPWCNWVCTRRVWLQHWI